MKRLGIVLGVLVGAFFVLGLVLPKHFVVEREIVINKPKGFVFSQLKQLKNHKDWGPWAKRDPNMITEYKGTDGTVGFVSAWCGNDEVGVGEQEIKNIVEGERLDLELRFKKPMENNGEAYFVTETVGENQTKVRWGMKGESKFPMNVVCLVINMKGMLAKDFDEGLTSLKTVLER